MIYILSLLGFYYILYREYPKSKVFSLTFLLFFSAFIVLMQIIRQLW